MNNLAEIITESMLNQHLSQLRGLLLDGDQGNAASPELMVLSRRLNELERKAVLGALGDEVDPRLADELLQLISSTIEYEEASLSFRRPAEDLQQVFARLKQGRAMLRADEIRIACLNDSQMALPGGQEEHRPQFTEAAQRFLVAAARLQSKVQEFALLEDVSFLTVYDQLLAGSPLEIPGEEQPDPALVRARKPLHQKKVKAQKREERINTTLLPREEEAYLAIRRPRFDQTQKGGATRSCHLWISMVAAWRLWVVIQLRGESAAQSMDLVADRAVATAHMVLAVLSSVADLVPRQLLLDLEASTALMLETAERLLAPLQRGMGGVEEQEDLTGQLAQARAGLTRVVDQLLGRVRVQTENQGGQASAADKPQGEAARQERKAFALYSTAEQRAWRRKAVGAALLVSGLCALYLISLRAGLNFQVLKPYELQAVDSQMQSGYLVKTEKGRTLVAQVSAEWSRMESQQRRRVVHNLMATYKDDNVSELLLKGSEGQLVARWKNGRLQYLNR